MTKLLIVESPAKAKTIEKYLDGEYKVMASIGHIRDLPKSNKKAVDIEGGFVPHYEIPALKKKIVSDLKSASNKAKEVVLATDPDREGEAIAWHLSEALGLKKAKRITFHEITKEAIQEAIKHPRAIDENLKEAQEARRVLDRLFGYDLSGLIWKKVRYGLSAGRVQSPALRIIMEREREIRAFKSETFYILSALLKHKAGELLFTCDKEIWDKAEVEKILEIAKKEAWSVIDIKESEQARNPRPPFTTSTLQQSASTRLGFAPSRTMGIAQKLYEKGFITYMRTDSQNISKGAQTQMIEWVTKNLGKEFAQANVYSKKSKNAQEAHEAIRPTHPLEKTIKGTDDEQKLYRLIWERAISSQMTPAKVLKTKISANTKSEKIPNFGINGSRVLFPGWLAVDTRARGEDVEVPKLNIGDSLELKEINSLEKQTEPPSRYSEAGLIKELEKRDIGRPSTYASIIRTIEERGYVSKEGRTLIPTDTGDVVSTFIENNFSDYISDSFTAEMENKLDEIAEGKRTYVKTLKDFYDPFTKAVKAKEKIEKITNLGDAPEEFACPECGKKMVWKLSKNGKFMSCSDFPNCQGARTAEGKVMEGPKEIGETCPLCGEKEGGKLVQREGRFGMFISCSRYPKCKFIKEDEEEAKKKRTGVKCTDCKDGEMVERRGRFGIFYSCSNYPDCKNAIKAKPTGNICDTCGKLMMEGTKTIPERCSNKTCPNHNPHKLKK
ncbi:MAG: type I DNA topoisomerase [Bacteroidetes bacterium]|nr:type I DNA topoisomerase [Bacteroidota bacterium]